MTSTPAGISWGPTCSAPFAYGTPVTLTAKPASGWAFVGWSGDCTGKSNSCALTLDADRSVTAQFGQLFRVVVKNGGGVSSPAGIACGTVCGWTFASGTTVTFTASPDSDYIFGACGLRVVTRYASR